MMIEERDTFIKDLKRAIWSLFVVMVIAASGGYIGLREEMALVHAHVEGINRVIEKLEIRLDRANYKRYTSDDAKEDRNMLDERISKIETWVNQLQQNRPEK